MKQVQEETSSQLTQQELDELEQLVCEMQSPTIHEEIEAERQRIIALKLSK